MVLLISYDLNNHERPSSYHAVAKAIEDGATSFLRPLYSQWLIETTYSPTAWREHLLSVLDADDRLFICPVVKGRDGWLEQEVWEWLRERGVTD
ncbi:MAG TPA: hypothetical protein VN758_00930 [Solirubrobacterales bacterium]|nr:hypothetical protein [Solirubrobacterales bacterium]